MSGTFPTTQFSWTNIVQTAAFANLDVGTSRHLTAGIANIVDSARNDSALHSPPHLLPHLEISPALEETEKRILSAMPAEIGRPPHIALFCPGASKVDPLYALRIMDQASERFSAPSRLTICEKTLVPETVQYYRELNWGKHEVTFRLGSSGDLKTMRGLEADLVLVFHPNMMYDTLHEALVGNLVSGGLALWQEDFYRNQPASDLEDILRLLSFFFEPTFALSQEPVAGPLVNTYFARILGSQIISFLLQKA